MNNSMRLFSGYLKHLLGKTFFWIFLLFDGLGLSGSLLFPNLNIPNIIFWILAFIGLMIANFEVFRELVPEKLEGDPQIVFNLIEGSGFEYSILEDLSSSGIKNAVPNSSITLHVRIQNLSYTPVRILSIRAKLLEFTNLHMDEIYENTSFDANGINHDSYPLSLASKEITLIDFTGEFTFSKFYNPAQFAGRITQDALMSWWPAARIEVEAQNNNGEIFRFDETLHFSLRPLLDRYLLYWKEHGYQNLIVIANVEPTNKVSPQSKSK